jgi:hypothetical protein
MRIIKALPLILFPIAASAATLTIPNSFSPGQKIVASQMNANFNAVAGIVNGSIASDNIVSLGITAQNLANGIIDSTKMATGSNAYIVSRRTGCRLKWSSKTTLGIEPPCELWINGSKGSITATQSITTTANADAALNTNNVNYVYGAVNGTSLSFYLSPTGPSTATGLKSSDSTKRYIGSVISGGASATTDIVFFRQDGNKTYLKNSDNYAFFYIQHSTASVVTPNPDAMPLLVFPKFAKALRFYFGFTGTVSAPGAGLCVASINTTNNASGEEDNTDLTTDVSFTSLTNSGGAPFEISRWHSIPSSGVMQLDLNYFQVTGGAGGGSTGCSALLVTNPYVTVAAWEEPFNLYQ